MRSHLRAVVALALSAGLVAWVLRDVNLRRMVADILHARPGWLLFSVLTMFSNLVIRAWRWQYLLAPLGRTRFGNAFRATAVGVAANGILPARAGELIRPYFLSRYEDLSATGAFATIILERLLDLLTVLVLLALFVFVFGGSWSSANPVAFAAVKWAGATVLAGVTAGLVALFVMAGDPARLSRALARLERVLPSTVALALAGAVEKFACGLAAIRSPGRLLVALAWSFPLWLSIALGIWGVTLAFGFAVPFTGTFLLMALLSIGVAIPTPGGVGGFHAAFRFGTTVFFGAPDDAAVGASIVLHALTVLPALALGLFFAAQAGLNVRAMRELAEEANAEPTS